MADPFFPFLSYGESALEDILQLWDEDGSTSPDALDASQQMDGLYSADLTALDWDSQLDIDPSAQTPDQLLADGNKDIWTTSVHFHANYDPLLPLSTWQLPAIDASICLGVTDAFPSPIMSNSTYPSLDSSLREELIIVYFNNVHPMCPIIDEQNFWWHHSILSEEEFFGMFPAIMFNAMMFAAFAHAKEDQVHRAGFQSIREIQEKYFRLLTEQYEYARCQVWSEIEELVLAKTALLLSFWCPPKVEILVNSLWIDRAIYHTKQFMRKSVSNTSNAIPKRCDILYWSCLSRNAFISYAMRRPYRLHIEEDALCDPQDVRSEFDREILFHNFSSPKGKLRMVDDFIALCKLGQSLNAILRSQRSMLFQLQWNSRQNTEDVDESEEHNELHQYLSRYLEAAKFESELLDLIEEHKKSNSISIDNAQNEGASEEMLARMRSYTLSIIAYSSIAALYQFTLSTTSETWARSCHGTALVKLKSASAKVSSTVESLLANVTVNEIPGTILSWTVSPMITFLVEQNCGKFRLSELSDDNIMRNNEDDFESPQLEHLLKLTDLLAPRFQSARDVWYLMQNTDHLLCCEAAMREDCARSRPEPKKERRRSSYGEGQAVYLDLLNRAVRFVDSEVAYGSP
ncbi:hypothetical protein B0J14DRAFT_707598 [Halenospora varia]|nr:hypothetical protein B0J14DRAFT_707598 [Halenospora varia]